MAVEALRAQITDALQSTDIELAEQLMDEAMSLAQRIAGQPPQALRLAKTLSAQGEQTNSLAELPRALLGGPRPPS